jgi:hypothetical protein
MMWAEEEEEEERKKVGGGFFSTPQNVPSQSEFEIYQTNRGIQKIIFSTNESKKRNTPVTVIFIFFQREYRNTKTTQLRT